MTSVEVCETGIWVDKDGNVVRHPVSGRQIVPPGAEMTGDRKAALARAEAAAPDAGPVSDPPPAEPEVLEADAPAPRKRAAKKAAG